MPSNQPGTASSRALGTPELGLQHAVAARRQELRFGVPAEMCAAYPRPAVNQYDRRQQIIVTRTGGMGQVDRELQAVPGSHSVNRPAPLRGLVDPRSRRADGLKLRLLPVEDEALARLAI